MVVLELKRPTKDDLGHAAGSETVARVIAEGHDVQVEPAEYELDLEQKALSPRSGELITAADDAEEWARGLSVNYRSPYLWAEIVSDSDPIPDAQIDLVELDDPSHHASPAVS